MGGKCEENWGNDSAASHGQTGEKSFVLLIGRTNSAIDEGGEDL